MKKVFPKIGERWSQKGGICRLCGLPKSDTRISVETDWFRGDDKVFSVHKSCLFGVKEKALLKRLLENKPETNWRVKYLAQVINSEWYEGKRTADTPDEVRCFTKDKNQTMKSDWPRFVELARSTLDVLDSKISAKTIKALDKFDSEDEIEEGGR